MVARHVLSTRFVQLPCRTENLTIERSCLITANDRCYYTQDSVDAVEQLVKNPHTIDFDAVSIGEFLDGGDGLYDGGNRITTSLCPFDQLRPYTDNFETRSSDCFGAGGEYRMNMGTSTLILETVNTHTEDISINIAGNLGSDGIGFGYYWQFQVGPIRGYGKCVCGNRAKPNVNHFFIVNSDMSPNLDHEIARPDFGFIDTNDDFDRLHGIGPGSPLVYGVYASRGGACHWDTENEAIFMAAADSCAVWSFGCSEESTRLAENLHGDWDVQVHRSQAECTGVSALATAPYAACMEGEVGWLDRQLGTVFDGATATGQTLAKLPANASIYIGHYDLPSPFSWMHQSCSQCEDDMFLSMWRENEVNCSSAVTDAAGPGWPDYAARVVDASWSAFNTESNRDQDRVWLDHECCAESDRWLEGECEVTCVRYEPSGDLMMALNGGDHWTRYRTGHSSGFQIDLSLGRPTALAGVSIMVHGEGDHDVGYSGIEILLSTNHGGDYTSVYEQDFMFGSFGRSGKPLGRVTRTTYPTVSPDFVLDTWTVHQFASEQANVTDVRILTGAADQEEDNSVSFHGIRIDTAGAYGRHCEPECPNGFYIAEVQTEWMSLVTLNFSVNLPVGAAMHNTSLLFGASPALGSFNESIGFEVSFVDGTGSIDWVVTANDIVQYVSPTEVVFRTPALDALLSEALAATRSVQPHFVLAVSSIPIQPLCLVLRHVTLSWAFRVVREYLRVLTLCLATLCLKCLTTSWRLLTAAQASRSARSQPTARG